MISTGSNPVPNPIPNSNSKQRKRMSPEVLKKLVYIRYAKKYRAWIQRLGICVTSEEMEEAIKKYGYDGYEEVEEDE